MTEVRMHPRLKALLGVNPLAETVLRDVERRLGPSLAAAALLQNLVWVLEAMLVQNLKEVRLVAP